jgi:hypothetical protein
MSTVAQYKVKSEELSESLLQLIQTRNTEPEERIAEMKAQYEAAGRGSRLLLDLSDIPFHSLTSALAHDELIKELTTQIARLTPMLKEGRGSTVHFLTRQAADEEKRMLEERLEKSKEALRQKDAIIKDKDARIAALNEQRTSKQ